MDNAARTQPVRLKKKKKTRRSRAAQLVSFGRVLIWVVLIFLCLAAAGVALAVFQVPTMAADIYGPPSPALTLPQRIIYSARLLNMQDSLLKPYQPGAEARTFLVELGEPVNVIALHLEEERFIGNADAFTTYLVYAGLDTGVLAGKYTLSPAMTPVAIAQALQDPAPQDVEFNILPGWRAEEIAAALPTSGIEVTPEEFLRVVYQPGPEVQPAGLQLESLEGFLMAGSYTIPREISAADLARLFTQRFEESLTQDIRDGLAAQGLDLAQGVTLASIIQKEAVVEEEQPVIASVFYNRLAIGMKLDSDPTVQYALGYDSRLNSWWKNPLTATDLQIDSRYNTYIYAGLPPGPIASPGLSALKAAANPAQTGYYYFRALCDGSRRHAFAVTYEEHLNNACQ